MDWRWIFRIAGFTFLLATVGWLFEAISWNIATRRDPEAGRLVDTGNGRRQIHCIGQGGGTAPTVILESGLGDLLEQWRRVQPAVSSFARVCSYDRAGYGGSDAGPFPRTADRISEELHLLLRQSGEKPPYILVGHSFGGYLVRVFHDRYPSEVAAMVLVDSTQEDQYQLLPQAWQVQSADFVERYKAQARWAPVEVGLGITRLKLMLTGSGVPNRLLQSRYFQARASEVENIRVSAEQARKSRGLDAKPLVVLTAGRNPDADFQGVWVHQLQSRLAKLSTNSNWILLADSGHDIPADQPDAIVDTIREMSGAGLSLKMPRKP